MARVLRRSCRSASAGAVSKLETVPELSDIGRCPNRMRPYEVVFREIRVTEISRNRGYQQ